MTDQQLQMVLTALQQLGAESKTAFIWWIALDKALPVIGWLATFAGIVFVAVRIINSALLASRIAAVCRELGIETHGVVLDSDVSKALARIRALKGKA